MRMSNDIIGLQAGFTTLYVPEGLSTTAGVSIAIQHSEALLGPVPACPNHYYTNTPGLFPQSRCAKLSS